jgi:DNA end-binding protein Ku
MAARSVWKGFISFGLVSVPVKAYTSNNSSASDVKFNQLHKECHSRIQYKKTCPVHGEVKQDDIVSGYEFAEGQYVLFDPEELDKLRSAKDKTISISSFVPPDAVDPVYYTGGTYYLVPDGPVAQKPYALLHKVMQQEDQYAFAQVVLRDREQIVLLRPMGRLVAMTFLSYAEAIKPPDDIEKEVVPVEVTPKELELAKTLTGQMAVQEFDVKTYEDKYKENVRKLIQAKVEGKEVIAPPAEEAPTVVINLMEALQQSVAAAKKAASGTADRPPRLVASGSAAKAKEQRKRKTS